MIMFFWTILVLFGILTMALAAFVNYGTVFGDGATGKYKESILSSPNYKDGKFWNLVNVSMKLKKTDDKKNPMSEFFFGKNKKLRSPKNPIDNVKFNKSKFSKKSDVYSWFGHSTILIKTHNKTIVVDPVFKRASPVTFMGPNEFKMKNKLTVDDLPNKIDILLITHDHYDHLDYLTIKKIHKNVENFIVPLGVSSHLIKWGVKEKKILETDWYNTTEIHNLNITFTPTKHFSGRGIKNRMSTLWGGWIIKSPSKNIYISGDGGYSNEFKKIGEKYGPFDIAFIENGAYNKAWSDVHMFPEEGVKAAKDVKAKISFPIHWGKYDLSIHPWTEPIERFTREASKENLPFMTPKIGEIFTEDHEKFQNKWWENK